MRALLSRSSVRGSVSAPPSKSYTIRGLVCAALAAGKSQIANPLGSDDTVAATRVLKQVGTGIRQGKTAWTVNGGASHAPEADLFCGESALTLRTMMGLAAVIPGVSHLTAGPSLSKRPLQPFIEALRQLGVDCDSNGGTPPVTVRGGKLRGGETRLPGDISSQYVSALLMVAPFADKSVTIRLTTPLESRPYVMMTMDAMQWFGITVAFNETMDEFQVMPQKYEPSRFHVEGDWSSASYPLALGALAGEVEVVDLPTETMQGDRMVMSFLQEMGAKVSASRGAVNVARSRLKAIKADLTDCTDLLPTVAVLAAAAEGTSVLSGIARARIKESDRVAAVAEGLARMGIRVTEGKDRITITGGKPAGAVIDSHNDHRLAMAFSLLGAVAGDTVIEPAECVSKTYPEFWDVIRSLGVGVTLHDQ